MKKIIFILLGIIFFFSSCVKDHSPESFRLISPIMIDLGDLGASKKLFQNDTLKVNPIIYKNGVRDENLKYKWEVRHKEMLENVLIGDKMTLNQPFDFPPNKDAYKLILTVTDAELDISEIVTANITVDAKYGEGLLVADSKDGGLTSDISLIMAMNFTSSHDEKDNIIYHDIYSNINKQKVEGGIVDMQSLIKSDSRTLTVLTDNSILRFDPYDFNLKDVDNDLFYVALDKGFKPMFIDGKNYGGYEIMNIDGKLYPRNSSWGNMFYNFYMFPNDEKDQYITHLQLTEDGYYGAFYCYDDANKRFLKVGDRYDVLLPFKEQNGELLFDVNNLGNVDVLSLNIGQKRNLYAIVKDKDSNETYIYGMQTEKPDDGENVPVLKMNISSAPDINKATGYAFSTASEDFFYVAENSVYTISLRDGVGGERCTLPDPADKITSIMIWSGEYQRVNTLDESDSSKLSSQNARDRMLVLTTYNETTKEGKVVTVPLLRQGDGSIERDIRTHTVYGGFGKISKVVFNKVKQ